MMISYRKVRIFDLRRECRSGIMDRNGVFVTFLLILIVAEGSDASFFEDLRRNVRIALKENSVEDKISPSPSPGPTVNLDDNQNKGHEGIDEKCDASSKRCSDQKKMIACLRRAESGSRKYFLLVHNNGETTLKVNVTTSPHIKIPYKELEIPKHEFKKIDISINGEGNSKIVLNSGNGKCVLHSGSSNFLGDFFQRLPSYATQVTPIYAAYFLFLIALIIGGIWACCKFRKEGKPGEGIPYQELEMAVPESASATNGDRAHGWDQDWDDDWDEEKAVKSPGVHHVGNVSANGLNSRSSNRNGWENDWND